MNQQHGSHFPALPQRQSESQYIVHQPRLPQQYHNHQSQYQHHQSHPLSHPYAVNQGQLPQVLQQSRHQLQHHSPPELPIFVSANPPQLRKGRWSPAEDERLRNSIRRHGPNKWKQVAKDVMSRSGDQCWKRWNDSLDPQLNHSQWIQSEDAILEAAVLRCGRLWSKIANDHLPGRSGLSCKNRWDHIQRKQRRVYQSQRELLQGHTSSRSFLDSTVFSEQRSILPRPRPNSGNTTSHSRFPSLSDTFRRQCPTHQPSIESQYSFEHEDSCRNLFTGTQSYRATPPRPIFPHSFAPFATPSWSTMAAGEQGRGAASQVPYIGQTTHFSTPKQESNILPTTSSTSAHGLITSSPCQTSTLSNYTSYSSNASALVPSRSWPIAPTTNNPQSTPFLAVLEPGACTGGMLTYTDEAEDGHRQEEESNNERSLNQTSFVTASATASNSVPDLPSHWQPSRAASLLSNFHRSNNYNNSNANQAALWTPRSNTADGYARSYPIAAPFLIRPGSVQYERMSDDLEPPRTQQSAPATTADTATTSQFKSSQDWQHPIMREEDCNMNNAAQLHNSQSAHPFAYSADELMTEQDYYTTSQTHPQREKIRQDIDNSDECESGSEGEEDGVEEQHAVRSILQRHLHSLPNSPTPKLEEMTHSLFYDDIRNIRQPRRNHQDDDATSDEADSQYADEFSASCSAPKHSASSFGSPRHRSTVASS